MTDRAAAASFSFTSLLRCQSIFSSLLLSFFSCRSIFSSMVNNMHLFSVLACVAAFALKCSEAGSPPPAVERYYVKLQSELDANVALWKRKASSNTYSMKFEQDCYCTSEYRTPVTEQVVDGRVKCAVYTQGGRADLIGTPAKYNGTIDALFAKVSKAIAGRYCDIQVFYHAELGYPTTVKTATSCYLADIPILRASDVRVGFHNVCGGLSQDAATESPTHVHRVVHHWHHHRYARGSHHTLTRVLVGCGAVLLSLALTVVTVYLVRRYCRQSPNGRTSGNVRYQNIVGADV